MSNQKLAEALRDCASYLHILTDAAQHGAKVRNPAAAQEAVNRALATLAEHDAAEHQEGLMIIGNPVDGFRFVGPFACESDGVEWAMQHAPNETWTTATMQEPQA